MALKVVLYEPEIPWNTGNIGRTCVAVGAELHLIGRLGFSLSERQIRRSGLDYWSKLVLVQHKDYEAFQAALPPHASILAFSSQGKKTHWDAAYAPDSYLIFGRESTGLPEALRRRLAKQTYRIPMRPEIRSLNLSTSAAIVLYEALRRIDML